MAANGFGLALGYQGFQELKSGIEDVVTSAVHFETTLNEVKQNTGLTTEQMGVLKDGVIALSAESGVATDLISAGWMHVMNVTQNAGDATGITEIAMKSAVSTGGDVAKTADVLARAMHEYGLDTSSAADATRHNEVLTNASSVMAAFHGTESLRQRSRAITRWMTGTRRDGMRSLRRSVPPSAPRGQLSTAD